MEYRKDKRTKNLTLRDIHVGDWVQVWSEQAERYSPPLKIIQICDDGTIYLVISNEERPTPWEEDIKDVDALEITPDLLKGFGLELVKKDYPIGASDVLYNGKKICELWEYNNAYEIATPWLSCWHFHQFIGGIYEQFPEILNIEWKGVEK